MVMTKRYNSVERFTSMNLSAGGEAAGQQPVSQLAIPPQQTWINQQPPLPPPQHITLERRRSNEHLLQPTPSSVASSPHSTILANPAMDHGGNPSQSFFQQPASRQQQQLNIPQPQPRSIMRPPSQPIAGPYGGMAPPTPSRQPYPIQYAIGPAQFQQRASPRSQSQPPPSQHLSDVYSQSKDDVELAENMRSYFARKVPAPIWLTLSAVQIVAGIVSLFIGALNASPYNCMVEPNIPIYLIISGILLIVNGGIRLFFFLTSSSNSSNKRQRRNAAVAAGRGGRMKKGGTPVKHLCEYALEGTVLFAIVIVVILGCVWVYGAQRFMHGQRYMFENHYCHQTVYWTAWWSVTLHLGFFALLILGAIILLLYGALMG